MAYNNFYPATYQPFQYQQYQQYPQYQNFQQMPQQYQNNMQPQQPQQIQNGGFISVHNIQEAINYPVAPGNSVTFKDENSPYISIETDDIYTHIPISYCPRCGRNLDKDYKEYKYE